MSRFSVPFAGALIAAVLAFAGGACAYGSPVARHAPSFAPRMPRGFGMRPAPEGYGARSRNPGYGPGGYPAGPPGRYVVPGPAARGPNSLGPNSLGADWREQQDEARQGVRQGQFAPLGRVIGGIARRTPGRQLDAGIEYMGDRPVYRVRWMTANGRRIDYIVDAASGAILSGR